MPLLIEDPKTLLNGNNVIGRLTYGLIGIDLKERKDQSAKNYLDACMSIFEDLDFKNDSSQLMSLFDFERPAKLQELVGKFKQLEPLMKNVYSSNNEVKIQEARTHLEDLLAELHQLVKNKEL